MAKFMSYEFEQGNNINSHITAKRNLATPRDKAPFYCVRSPAFQLATPRVESPFCVIVPSEFIKYSRHRNRINKTLYL
jgi:hypothetical protein